jgi:poly(3-hydroxyalkanoate) depolymerase
MTGTASSPAGLRRPRLETIALGSYRVRVATWHRLGGSERPPILFLNGLGANLELIAPLGDVITDRDLIVFDVPGVGESPPPIAPYRFWHMARLSTRLLDHYRHPQADVIGVSWGGGLAQQLAFQHPRRVRKLVLLATSAGAIMVPGRIGSIAAMMHPRRYLDTGYLRTHFQRLYGGDATSVDDYASRVRAPSLRGYFFQLLAVAGWTSVPFLPLVGKPALVMAGEDDRVVPVANAHILHALLPNSRLLVVRRGGHLFIISRAREVVPAILSFLDE